MKSHEASARQHRVCGNNVSELRPTACSGRTRSDGPGGLRLATREWGDYSAHYRAPGMGVRAARTAPSSQ